MGLVASISLIAYGSFLSSSLDFKDVMDLPSLPVLFLKSSALCGGLVEFFMGKGALTTSALSETFHLHPLAVAGVLGSISNALALLPFGHTDGGRVALTMFGRRGAYLVKTFSALILCVIGLFGLDEAGIFLTYVLFTIIWQRELDAPVQNEVDELDFTRGLVGIVSAIFVALVLVPML